MLSNTNLNAMPDLSGQVAKEKPIGSFSQMQDAMSVLREASGEVWALASDLVGQEPQATNEPTGQQVDCASGALWLLDDEADEVVRIAKDIINQVKRIREKAC